MFLFFGLILLGQRVSGAAECLRRYEAQLRRLAAANCHGTFNYRGNKIRQIQRIHHAMMTTDNVRPDHPASCFIHTLADLFDGNLKSLAVSRIHFLCYTKSRRETSSSTIVRFIHECRQIWL